MPDVAMMTRLGGLLIRHLKAFNTDGSAFPGTDEAVEADAEKFTSALEDLGPTFIKFGQLLSTRQDLLPPAYTTALARLQDDVDPVPVHIVREQIEGSLGVPVGALFSEFDDTPLASASLAQAHRAVTKTGRDVVVKVLRPGVREKVRGDLDSLADLAQFADKNTPIGPRLGASRMLAQFRRSMADELDYIKEAANLALFAELVEDEDDLLVPGSLADYSTDDVLTLEFVPGRKITDVGPIGMLDVDGAGLAASLFRFMLKTMLVDGILHADPHPGNLFLTPENRIALLDLGMVVRLPRRLRTSLVKLLVAIGDSDGEVAATVLAEMGHATEDFDAATFRTEVSHLVTSTLSLGPHLQAGSVLMQLARLAGTNGLRPPTEMSMVAKALLNLDRTTQHLDQGFTPLEAIRENLPTVLAAGLKPSPGQMLLGSLEGKEFVERLPHRANRLLDALAAGELSLKVDAFDESRVLMVLQQVSNRLAAALILAAITIAAALLIFGEVGPSLLGYSALGVVFFLIAAVAGLVLVVRILFQDRTFRGRVKRHERRARLSDDPGHAQ